MVAFPLLAGLVVGPGIGLLATIAMDRVMARLPEGDTPPRVAAGVLTNTRVDDAPARLATWVHYVAGAGSGVLFVGLVAAVGAIAPVGVSGAVGRGAPGGVDGMGAVLTVAVAGAVMLGLMVGFFALVPLPRAEGLARQRLATVRRDWAVSAATYVVVAAALVLVADAVGV